MFHKKTWFVDFLILAIIISSYLQRIGTYYDAAYHVSLPTVFDEIITTQHIPIYIAYIMQIIAIVIAGIGFFHYQNKRQYPKLGKLIGLIGIGVLSQFAASGIDQVWHRIFGIDKFSSPPHVLLIASFLLPLIFTIALLRYHLATEAKQFLWEKFSLLILFSLTLLSSMMFYLEYDFLKTDTLYTIIYHSSWIVFSTVIFSFAKAYSSFNWSASIIAILFVITRYVTSLIIFSIGMQYPPAIPSYLPWIIIYALAFDLYFRFKSRNQTSYQKAEAEN